ncbi:MAG TPA: hypothetical protein VFZ03_07490 [Dongiaceae bacterium]
MKPLSGRAEERDKAGAAPLRRPDGFGADALAPGGFGRRKTPIPETTDGAAPSRVANDHDVNDRNGRGAVQPVGLRPAQDDANEARAAPVAGDDLANTLVAWLSGELRRGKQVQQESVLCALGALAGYAAQQAIRETVVKTGRLTLDQAFVVIETRSGEVFFFGELLNAVIVSKDGAANAESGHASIWKVVSSAGYEAGAINLPDVTDMIKHCAATVGGPEFGMPRVPEAHLPEILPREAVSRFWPAARRKLASSEPMSWPLHLAMAAHALIVELKDAIRPDIAVQIVMEAAVPMSKIDPVTLPRE